MWGRASVFRDAGESRPGGPRSGGGAHPATSSRTFDRGGVLRRARETGTDGAWRSASQGILTMTLTTVAHSQGLTWFVH